MPAAGSVCEKNWCRVSSMTNKVPMPELVVGMQYRNLLEHTMPFQQVKSTKDEQNKKHHLIMHLYNF